MTEELGELDAILIASAATHGHGTSVIEALKAIISYSKKGEAPPALVEWFEKCLVDADKQDSLNTSTAGKQRGFSRAFGYTPSRGNPHDYGARNFKLVWDIWHIHKSQGASLPKAIRIYVNLNPGCVGPKGCTEYINDLIRKYGKEVSELYEQWIELMEKNRMPQ